MKYAGYFFKSAGAFLFKKEPDAVFCLCFYDSPFSNAKFVIKYEVRVFMHSCERCGDGAYCAVRACSHRHMYVHSRIVRHERGTTAECE